MNETLFPKIRPVILCGGAGTRLYPLSTIQHPKQFLKLFGDLSLFQQTFQRVSNQSLFSLPWIISGENYLNTLQEQLSAINADFSKIILEKEAKGTAFAMLISALIANHSDPEMVMAFFPSDHLILHESAFIETLNIASNADQEWCIVLIGIEPTRLDINFGYILSNESEKSSVSKVFKVSCFIEKPSLMLTKSLIEQGGVWNSGIYVFRPKEFIEEMKYHSPDLYQQSVQCLEKINFNLNIFEIPLEGLSCLPNQSIDYALTEKCDRLNVVPASFEWDDVGTWEGLWRSSFKDRHSNFIAGDVSVDSAENCYIKVEKGKKLLAKNLKNVAIYIANDLVYISKLNIPKE